MAWAPARSCRTAFEAFEAWQTAGLNALHNRGQWPECLLEAAAQRCRHWRPGKRQAWTPLTTESSGLSACSKLPHSVWAWQTAGLNALNNRGAVAGVPARSCRALLKHLRPGKRQAWTPLTTEGSDLSACSKQAWTPLTTEGSGLSAWRKAR